MSKSSKKAKIALGSSKIVLGSSLVGLTCYCASLGLAVRYIGREETATPTHSPTPIVITTPTPTQILMPTQIIMSTTPATPTSQPVIEEVEYHIGCDEENEEKGLILEVDVLGRGLEEYTLEAKVLRGDFIVDGFIGDKAQKLDKRGKVHYDLTDPRYKLGDELTVEAFLYDLKGEFFKKHISKKITIDELCKAIPALVCPPAPTCPPCITPTPTYTATATPTPPYITPTKVPPTRTPGPTPTYTPTPKPTKTPEPTPTYTPMPTRTPEPTPTEKPTKTPTPTEVPPTPTEVPPTPTEIPPTPTTPPPTPTTPPPTPTTPPPTPTTPPPTPTTPPPTPTTPPPTPTEEPPERTPIPTIQPTPFDDPDDPPDRPNPDNPPERSSMYLGGSYLDTGPILGVISLGVGGTYLVYSKNRRI